MSIPSTFCLIPVNLSLRAYMMKVMSGSHTAGFVHAHVYRIV